MALATRAADGRATVSELELAADSSRLETARRSVEQAAAQVGLDAQASQRFVYAVNEAVTNAIRHGAPDSRGLIRLCTVIEDELLTVHVHDSGTFVGPTTAPGPLSEHGRGFGLMARFADQVRITTRPGSTTVSLSVSCPT
jgi:anti-sigma regulatory factor (Ser/Thr protein kinase)